MLQVLLIEDEPKTALSIQAFLNENNMTCQVAHTVDSGIKIMEKNKPDVLITDVVMPGKTGISLVNNLRNQQSKIPILMISALGETEDKIHGLEAGADDYLAKPFNLQELYARIMALHRRSSITTAPIELLQYEDLEANLQTLTVTRAGQKINLTPKEFALLEYFMRNHDRVLPKNEILEKVWGLGEEINTNVVEVYVNYLRKKIDKHFATKLIHTHFGIGYFLKKLDAEA
jgi:two-component system, OmpR family, copper resistance phosphate regulon response regulator CusR